MPRAIELLAPAKNADCAIEALRHGADAVYIGAPAFGARAAASNSVEDIATVVEFAHRVYARVYVTLNTLLDDEELKQAQALVRQLYAVGVDALIVQDTGLCRLDLPPMALHASTQMDNRTPEKLAFLHQVGFQQAVLARELSIDEIRTIHQASPIRLEAFVHGALCVSYSGQCYMSQYLAGRSANKGVCAQFCRLPYDLVDANGRVLMSGKHLLSLRDLHQGEAEVEALIDAGVSSFKIEGRLKDVDYVKNVTAWYRQCLDRILARRPDLKRASSGREEFAFQPDVNKSFNRSFTHYFLYGRGETVWNFDTPKSMGESVGFMRAMKQGRFVFLGNTELHNGDGLSYFNEEGRFDGFGVNKVEGNLVYPANPRLRLKTGIPLYRTFDRQFTNLLSHPSAQRRLPVTLAVWETPTGFALQMDDAEGHRCVRAFDVEKTAASKPQQEAVKALFMKSSDEWLCPVEVSLQWSAEWFIPLSVWTRQRNLLAEAFLRVRRISRPVAGRGLPASGTVDYPERQLDYRGNVANRMAREFYLRHGVEQIQDALEIAGAPKGEICLMRCRHCLKFALKACPKRDGRRLDEPLYLRYKDSLLPLRFDCKRCEMSVWSPAQRADAGR